MSRVRDDLGADLAMLGFEVEVPFRGLSGRRRWRWDWARVERLVAVEYDGIGVGHQSIGGTWRDAEKSNEGQLSGWLVIRCNAGTVEDGRCIEWVFLALGERDPDPKGEAWCTYTMPGDEPSQTEPD